MASFHSPKGAVAALLLFSFPTLYLSPALAYELTETDSSDSSKNVIVKYEPDSSQGSYSPKYYKVNLDVTQYGNKSGSKTISVDSPYSKTGTILFNYVPVDLTGTSNARLENHDFSDQTVEGSFFNLLTDGVTQGGAIANYGDLADINADFYGNSILADGSAGHFFGGAITNYEGVIGDINGNFIKNRVAITNANGFVSIYGGAIINSCNSLIGDITGDFVENSSVVSSINGNVVSAGGAISNESSSIDSINGNFVNNIASAETQYGESEVAGGAITNNHGANIGTINANFIGNKTVSIADNSAVSYGGALYSEGNLESVKGDFIQNASEACSEYDAYSYGGAIAIDSVDVNSVAGNFIQNYVKAETVDGYASASGGAISSYNAFIYDISGDFIANYANAISDEGYAESYGGAIQNSSLIANITGDFISNKSDSLVTSPSYAGTSAYSYGGAIVNDGLISNINGNFYNNSSSSSASFYSESLGGAVSNMQEDSVIDKIAGNFSNNSSTASDALNSFAGGGAIYNAGTIGSIKGDFYKNAALSSGENSNAYGGALLNSFMAGKVEGNFVENYAKATGENALAYGGAIYNESLPLSYDTNMPLQPIEINVVKIKMNDGTEKVFSTSHDLSPVIIKAFIDNNKTISSYDISTEIMSENEVKDIMSESGMSFDSVDDFINFVVSSEGAIEGDFGKYLDENYPVSSLPATSMVISNASFINNHAESDGTAKGGAIYSTHNIKIQAKDGYTSLISGNYTVSDGERDDNAIYMANSTLATTIYEIDNPVEITSYKVQPSSLILEAKTNGTIQIDDKISGEKGGSEIQEIYDNSTDEITENVIKEENDENYKIYVTGDSTGKIVFNNDVEGEADMFLNNVTLKLGTRDDVLRNNNMTFNSGTFDMVNSQIGSTAFNTLTLNNTIQTTADVNLQQETMDRITANNYVVNNQNNPNINVTFLNLLNDTDKDSVSILYADKEIANNVQYKGDNPISVNEKNVAYSPIYKYDIAYNIKDDDMGYFVFNRGNASSYDSYNPSALSPSISSQAGAYTSQLQTFEYAFKHSDAFMALPSFERMAVINSDRYAYAPTSDTTDVGNFSPLLTKLDMSGVWVKPYSSFENIPLNNGPDVSNISYGTLVGYDTNLRHLRNGWERVLTGYLGYNGASQRYSGIDTYQNGGLAGLTATLYKNNFFNATTISAGASVGSSSTYYGDEDYTMFVSGIGNKFGYNFEFKDGKFIFQPNLLLTYTFVNTFDYTSAAGYKVKSDPLHAIQIAPGVKFIMNTESGWQPYLRADMIWNILDKTKVTANDVRLPEMSIDPYVQYGVGVQKLFKNDRLTFFGQALVQNGGRNGVTLNAGLRFAVGKE